MVGTAFMKTNIYQFDFESHMADLIVPAAESNATDIADREN